MCPVKAPIKPRVTAPMDLPPGLEWVPDFLVCRKSQIPGTGHSKLVSQPQPKPSYSRRGYSIYVHHVRQEKGPSFGRVKALPLVGERPLSGRVKALPLVGERPLSGRIKALPLVGERPLSGRVKALPLVGERPLSGRVKALPLVGERPLSGRIKALPLVGERPLSGRVKALPLVGERPLSGRVKALPLVGERALSGRVKALSSGRGKAPFRQKKGSSDLSSNRDNALLPARPRPLFQQRKSSDFFITGERVFLKQRGGPSSSRRKAHRMVHRNV